VVALPGHPACRRPGRSRAGTWPPVKVVRPVGRSTLTGGQNPAPQACGSTADGMAYGVVMLVADRHPLRREPGSVAVVRVLSVPRGNLLPSLQPVD
jgi:hypothetical protein